MSCGHEYTDPRSIRNPEIYTDDYFEEAHRNWFANPHIDLFVSIESVISQTLDKRGLSARILDVGCGKGALLKHLSKAGYNCLTGIDICEPPKDDTKGIRFLQTSIEEFTSSDKFDVILSTLAIEHVVDPGLMLCKLRDLLEPGGIAIVVTNDVQTPLYKAAKLLRRVGLKEPYERLYHPHHLNHLSRKILGRIACESGFRVLDTYGLDVPFEALDIPSESHFSALVKGMGVRALFFLGKVSGHRFLQIQVFSKLEAS